MKTPKSINEQLSDLDKARTKIWLAQGMTPTEIAHELLIRELKKTHTNSKLLDYVIDRRNNG